MLLKIVNFKTGDYKAKDNVFQRMSQAYSKKENSKCSKKELLRRPSD